MGSSASVLCLGFLGEDEGLEADSDCPRIYNNKNKNKINKITCCKGKTRLASVFRARWSEERGFKKNSDYHLGRQTFRIQETWFRKNKCSLVIHKGKEQGKVLSLLECVLLFLSRIVWCQHFVFFHIRSGVGRGTWGSPCWVLGFYIHFLFPTWWHVDFWSSASPRQLGWPPGTWYSVLEIVGCLRYIIPDRDAGCPPVRE